MTESSQLLAQYVQNGSEPAFRELVNRYVDLVYSSAVRLVDGDTHLAEDVTQTVFADLARAARNLSPQVMLGGWLHRHTYFVAAKTLRGERRRQSRERRAVEMNVTQDYSEANLKLVAPILDEAINELCTEDRAAIILRFFEQHDFRAVGAKLGSTEEAARKRVARALEKLEALLRKRGVALSATMLGASLAGEVVTAAPAGLAVAVSTTALSSAASHGGMAWGLFKILTMSKLKAGIIGALIVAGVSTPWIVQKQARTDEVLRRQADQLAQLTAENERLSKLLPHAKASRSLRLPAPAVAAAAAPTAETAEDVKSPLIARMLNGGEPPKLTAEQVESYLKENHRTAASLLAAFRASGDLNLLQEAMEKFPDDPRVAFAAVSRKDASPEEHRRWLDKFKQSAPNNALANYLSALDYFKMGHSDQAVQELIAVSGKSQFQDYAPEFVQNDEELWRASNYSVAESKTLASMLLVLPHLAPLKELTQDMVSLANSYREAGDDASAQAALRIGVNLGERLDSSPAAALVTRLVGIAIESIALRAMDPNSLDAGNGQTAQQRIDDLTRQRADLRELVTGFDAIQQRVSEHDWISYKDRWRSFGEPAAAQWLRNKYREQ
jgi:RNA polymerase sigma factor (sigma-70 family)